MKFRNICPCINKISRDLFCFCLPIEYGVIIIGVINIATFVLSCINADLVGMGLKLFATGWFVAMIIKDSKSRRLGLLGSYLA